MPLRSLAISAALVLLCVLAVVAYRSQQWGPALYREYFDPRPADGYRLLRALGAETEAAEPSLLRQAVTYHQRADHDLALTAFRAYLDGHPPAVADRTLLLAATAAMATGSYAEAGDYLGRIDPQDQSSGAGAAWYSALLALRRNDRTAALRALRPFADAEAAAGYAHGELVRRLEE